MPMDPLSLFDPLTARWFTTAVGTPTAVQAAAWPAIAAGDHTLVSAPTGTGKTLSAFLVFIDRLMAEKRAGTLGQELALIYVSPLKSLAGDIRENLRRPLDGILAEERVAGTPLGNAPDSLGIGLTVAIRTGDTTPEERRRMLKTPPHILITTPESLYLLLTAKSGQAMLRTARYLILDELHALIDSKRGAHLMLSVARLDRLCRKPVQRIGLSATIEPLSVAAGYLSPDPVTIAAPKMQKKVRLEVISPLTGKRIVQKDSVWQEIAAAVYERCREARSTIAFVEGRAYAEKLAYYVNQKGGEDFARTHHGSLSKNQRFEVENALRSGTLRLLCATSSMELGIDVGDIDQVFQIGCPRSISGTMQRLGRAGHNPDRTSVMVIFPRAAAEGLYSGLAAEVVRQGGVEHSKPPRLCLDVLAQHLVSMASGDGYTVDEVLELLRRARPFREVTKEDVRGVLRMLAGDYEHGRDIPVRPRVLYDRIHDRVEGDPYSRMLAVSAAGTIPDKGLYAVRTESGVRLGELDEEFVFEARVGDKFLLGAFAWQIAEIRKDAVTVKPTGTGGARPPFWKGEIRGRSLGTGLAYGEILRRLTAAREAGKLLEELGALGLDETSAKDAEGLLGRQLAATEALPDDRTILVEHFQDETGIPQLMVHSVFGRPVNEPLAILCMESARQRLGTNVSFVADDDGFLLFPFDNRTFPERLLQTVQPESAGPVLAAILPVTPLFNMAFRYNAGRALMMGVRKAGRQPLWVQRLRSAEMLDSLVKEEGHPLIRETRRECLEDYWDLPGTERILSAVRAGTVRVVEIHTDVPSPLSMPLRRQTEAAMMYDYFPTPNGVHAAVQDALDKTLSAAAPGELLPPSQEVLDRLAERRKLPQNENELHSLLLIEGDLTAGELDIPASWLEELEGREQAGYIEPGLWIAAEHGEEYEAALCGADREARTHIVRRLLRYRGAQSAETLTERYVWTEAEAVEVLKALCGSAEAVEYEGLYYHAAVFDRARRETVKARRTVKTLPPERYAALLASRVGLSAPPKEQLEAAVKSLSGVPYPPAMWEGLLLPARVGSYHPELLDSLLAQGSYLWEIEPGAGLSFRPAGEFDWDVDPAERGAALQGGEKAVFEALSRRGASFLQRLSDIVTEVSLHDALLSLAEKGLVTADSFVPVRQLLCREEIKNENMKRRARAHVITLTSGRWELTRPLRALTPEELLERAFGRAVLLCRETVQGLGWEEALKTLRLWEYTGRVRRGYFIEGLSGMQFIREKDYAAVLAALENPDEGFVWLPGADPAQPWGKILAHGEGRSFLNVPGTAAALRAGRPVAVFERQGKTLRVFDDESLPEALKVFTRTFAAKRIFPELRRLTVKEYPADAGEVLLSAGFTREMQDFVLYR